MREPFPLRNQSRSRAVLLVGGLVGVFYLVAHLWVTSGEAPPSTGPAPSALRPATDDPGASLSAGDGARAVRPTSAPALGAPASRPPAPPYREVSEALSPDRTIAAELGMHGVGPAAVNELVTALAGLFDFRKARAGNRYSFTFRTADARLTKFRLEAGPLDVYEAVRDANDRLVGSKVDVPVRTEIAEFGAELQVSLYQAMRRANESPTLVSRLVDVFAWDLDFYKDPRPGDSFKVVVEKIYSGDKLIKYGRLLAAEYNSRKLGTFRVYEFTPDVKTKAPAAPMAGYYIEDGQSARKMFLKTPLKFARISSKFDLHRKHPILKYTRAHLGIDFAARTGTPVWSMAGGVVAKAAFERGFGNLVVINHMNGLMSFYAHLSRFARGLKSGTKVDQKQLVGYVGSTGMSTGPHLHFGVKRNGGWINPEGLKMTRDSPVPPKFMAAFKKQVAAMKAHLLKIEVRAAPKLEPEETETDTDDSDDEAATPARLPQAANTPVSGPTSAAAPASAAP